MALPCVAALPSGARPFCGRRAPSTRANSPANNVNTQPLSLPRARIPSLARDQSARITFAGRSRPLPLSASSRRSGVGQQVRCAVASKGTSFSARTVPASQYTKVANFMVETYYMNGDPKALPGGPRRRLEGDQVGDLRRRFVNAGIRDAAVITVEGEKGKIGGCVAVCVTAFTNDGRLDMDLDRIPYKGDTVAPVIANLAVSIPLRRKGLGRLLMQKAEDTCKEWGYDEVWLGVEASNRRARSLYSKLGYKHRFTVSEPAVKVVDGAIIETTTKNVYLRKSLRGGLAGAVENAPWEKIAIAVAAVAAVAVNKDIISAQLTSAGLDAILLNRFGN
mmetsp:Transcript_31877/g.57045  ORF Transcript_31877/g.57045 Transcript_31877/m.57045 type:complete len:335 (-) Transcript_31877:67-1071(-)